MSPRNCPAPVAPPVAVAPALEADEELARLAKALGHPARVKIMRRLLELDECMAGAIGEDLPLAQSTVSQHLKVLREAGLIHGEVAGTRICYCADAAGIERLRRLLDELVVIHSG
jgi:ArsR family transcriptional regulator, arsenate/arsenite/antimonite-responsive transcriptional repressor